MISPEIVFEPLSAREFERELCEKGSYSSAQAFFDYVSSQNWIFRSSEINDICHLLRKNYPEFVKTTIGHAEHVCENCFDVLGSGPTYLGAKIDWHLDFKSGRTWKRDFYRNVPLIFWGDDSDVKVPWELSRFQYLISLALAYRLTTLNKYHHKFTTLIEDWIYENPCPYGINWVRGMEISIRALNWLAAYELFNPESFAADFKSKFFNALYQHGYLIRQHLTNYAPGVNNNHYLLDLTGLLVVGRLFHHLEEGRFWHEFARKELEKEVFNQVSPDGTCYESSLNYQIMMLDIFLFVYAFERRFGCGFQDEWKARIMQSCAALYSLSKNDNTVPNFGDSGSDRLFKIVKRHERDTRDILDLAAVIVGLKGYCTEKVNPVPELLLWCGEKGFRRYFDRLVSERKKKHSMFFGDSGLAVLRDERSYMGFFANAATELAFAGHKHNDLLSIEFSYGRENFIVDSGTYVYTGEPSCRNYFRKTASHSTLEVDSQEINRFLPKILFSVRKDAEINNISWESNHEFDSISASHSGYMRLDAPVMTRRSIHFDKAGSVYLIKDEFLGSGDHSFSGNIILNQNITAGIMDNQIVLKSASGQMAMIIMVSGKWYLENIPHYISKRYGEKLESWKIRYSLNDQAPQTCIWGLFGADSYKEMQRKSHHFYSVLNRLGWRTKTAQKLKLKRGSEELMAEQAMETILTPGLEQLRESCRDKKLKIDLSVD
jgi:hypothetical protein